MTSEQAKILPGVKVKVFDYRLFIDDKKTPLSLTMQLATVIRRYGKRSEYNPSWIYPDLVDIVFDRDGKESKGHFTDYITIVNAN